MTVDMTVDSKYREYEEIIRAAVEIYGSIRGVQRIRDTSGKYIYQVEGTVEHAIYQAWGMLSLHIRAYISLNGIEKYIDIIKKIGG